MYWRFLEAVKLAVMQPAQVSRALNLQLVVQLHQAVKATEIFAELSEQHNVADTARKKRCCLLAHTQRPIELSSEQQQGDAGHIVGTLDVVLQAALDGEVLIGRRQPLGLLAS